MTWKLTAKLESDGSLREFVYEDEMYAREGEEAMNRGGYTEILLEEVDDGVSLQLP